MANTNLRVYHNRVRERPEDLSFEELLTAFFASSLSQVKASDLAHSLACLARSEKGLMYLEPEMISAVTGMSKARCSSLLAAIELARRQHSYDLPKRRRIEPLVLAQHLQSKLEGMAKEYFYLFSFNQSFGLIREHVLAKGASNSVQVYFRDILKTLLNDRASQCLIAHNHPDESALPSPEDMQSMMTLSQLLEEVGIDLADQYIVGLEGVYSCKETKWIIAKSMQQAAGSKERPEKQDTQTSGLRGHNAYRGM